MKKSTFLKSLLVSAVAVFSTANAQELGLKAVGGGLGLANPEGIDSVIMFEGAADLGTIAENIGLDARIGFWSKSEGSLSFRDLIVGAAVSYEIGDGESSVKPFVGGGLSLHFYKAEVEIDLGDFFGGVQSSSATSTELGIDLRGGAKLAMNEQVDLVGEVMYTLGDAEQLAIKVGALFNLGK